MKNFSIKRFTASLLFIVMVVAALPVSLFNFTISTGAATGETIYVLAGSDFQPTDASNTTGVNLLNKILDKVDDKYTTMNGFLFAGDYDYNYTASQSGKEALQSAVRAVYGTGMNEIYVQGNHDADNLVGSVLSSSGSNDTENYGVFVINEKDYMWYNDDEATIKNTAANLETYLNAKRNAGYTKPIFVMSHLPLHYCMRTQVGGGDGKHANYIFDVLNEAGAAGLNIIFMFGHNHSHGWDDPYGGAAIFLKKGDSINIAQNSTTNYNVETLNFTYMNAGYVSYYRNVNSGAETDLSMTVFAITDTDVTIERYTADGLHDLKSAGVANTHASTGKSVDGSCSTNHGGNETYSPDTSVVASAYTMTLNTEITPAGTEVEAPDSGTTTTQRTYTRVTSTSELVSGEQYLLIVNHDTVGFMTHDVVTPQTNRTGFDMEATSVAGGTTISGDYSQYEWTLTGSNSAGWVISTNGSNVYFDNADGTRAHATLSTNNSTTFTIAETTDLFTFDGGTYAFDESSAGVINGYNKTADTEFYIYRLTNEGSSTPTVETSGGNWVTITKPTEAGTKYVYELDTDGVDTGVEYLIVANSYPKALSAAASSNNAVDIEISGNYAYADSDNYGWTFTQYSSGVYYIRLNDSSYLHHGNGTLTAQNYSYWTVASNNDGSYGVTRSVRSGWNTYTYNLRWSNSNGVFQASSSNKGPVRLYKYVKTETTQATPGLYGKISGELTYNVAIGTSDDDAIAAVQAGIDVLYHTGDESAAITLTDDEEKSLITWTLDPSYDGVTPGEYAVTIKYGETVLGVAKVVVPSVNITGYSVEPAEGTVSKGASQTAQTGALIYVQLEDGKYYTVPVTVAMLTKADGSAVSTGEMGTFENLTLTYNGVVITNNFTLNVVAKAGNNYPEYPNEGAVTVNKVADATKLQSTGLVNVELSTSGLPVEKGADVIVMLDTSSSMTDEVDGQSRLEVLQASLKSLLTQLQADGVDGEPMDIRIAVADFNRYFLDPSSPYYINSADHLINGSIRSSQDEAPLVYTGTEDLTAGAFVDVHTLAVNHFSADGDKPLNTASGTNYDYAFDAVYQLGEAITIQNAANEEERDLYVIFMSDGAPFQFNYFSAQSGTEGGTTDARYWNNWLTGTLTDDMKDANARNDYYNEDGKHWMAEAIKGDPGNTYSVIRKNNASDLDEDTWVNVNGLGAKMFSIGFCLANDKEITVDTMDTVIRNIASSNDYYFRADSADALNDAFTKIGSEVIYAATEAYFVDQMGQSFDLMMGNTVDKRIEDGGIQVTTLDGFTTQIQVLQYQIYTSAHVGNTINGVTVTESMVGERYGDPTVVETITFKETMVATDTGKYYKDANGVYWVIEDDSYEGTRYSKVYEVYSDQIDGGNTNILKNDIITAKNFWYNTSANTVKIDTDGDGTADYDLLSETFYWNIGTINNIEWALSYWLYLTGSMEGNAKAGSYKTNESATLYYVNWLGNDCQLGTTSPQTGWKSANVSYAFYLVDKNGNPVVNQTTGQTGSFYEAVKVTQPVVFQEILLNNLDKINTIEASSHTILPDGYELYDESASYKVVILSEDGKGSWTITYGDGKVQSSYVTGYSGTFATNAALVSSNITIEGFENYTLATDYDYSHTTVWFALLWIPTAIPDQVVVDYGLPVDISVLGNDQFGENGTLNGIGLADAIPIEDDAEVICADAPSSAFANTPLTLTYGVATMIAPKVRYTPANMQMSGYDQFAYEVAYKYYASYDANGNPEGDVTMQYYYGTVTVIPATTIYYEESFVTYTPATNAANGIGEWSDAGTSGDITQGEDRPGQYSLPAIDANNVYGYDSIYNSYTKYSLGNAKVVSVNSEVGYHKDNAPKATFTFTGTGFDVISLTNSNSGAIFVNVNGGDVDKTVFVDNYYSYAYNETDGWHVLAEGETPDDSNNIYQVPVIKISDLGYGTYTVTIWVVYNSYFDHDSTEGYSFWLDSIRIYDPAGTTFEEDSIIGGAYEADNEYNPQYFLIRDMLVGVENGVITSTTGSDDVVFIDGNETATIAQYANPGPNNEVYLAYGQSIAFNVAVTYPATPDDNTEGLYKASKPVINLGAKIAYGGAITVGLNADKTKDITTTTDMYHTMPLDWAWTIADGKVTYTASVVLTNTTPDTVLSLTNIKITENTDEIIQDLNKSESTSGVAYSSRSAGSYFTLGGVTNLASETEEVVENIEFYVDQELVDYAASVMAARFAPEPEPVPVFTPEVLEYVVTPGFFGTNTIRVITSKDVASLTVNGIEAKKINDSRTVRSMLMLINGFGGKFGIKLSANDYYVWSITTKRVAAYDIVAYNAEGVSSDPSVAESAPTIDNDDILNFFDRSEILGIMEEIANKRFDPETFETYVNERFDGKREIITQTSEDVEYVIIDGKIVDRYITETVIDTETGEEVVKRVWITDADDEEDVEVNVYDEKGVGSESRNAERKSGFNFGSKKTEENEKSESSSKNNGKNGYKNYFDKNGRM